MAIKVIEVRRVGHNRDMLNNAMNTKMNVAKQPDGQYRAEIMGHNVVATAPTMEDAVRAAKREFHDKFRRGEQAVQRTV